MTAVLTRRNGELVLKDHQDVSYCGCSLPEGVWGGHGWHQTRVTPAVLMAMEKARWAKDRKGAGLFIIAAEWQTWVETEKRQGRWNETLNIHTHWEPYLGTVLVLEPCPAYRSVVAGELAREKRRKAPGKRMYGDGGED